MTFFKHIPVLLIAAMSLLIAACGDDSCYDNGSSLPLATFFVGNSQQTINGLTIEGINAPGDARLIDSSSVNEAYLPLRASATSTSFRLWHWISLAGDAIQLCDTITLDYQPIEYFHSNECGAMFNFNINHVLCTHHGIDSVVLLTPLVTNAKTPALRIYFNNSSQ